MIGTVNRVNAGEIVTADMIKRKAKELTNHSDFIASKGWLDKFKQRYNLKITPIHRYENLNKFV